MAKQQPWWHWLRDTEPNADLPEIEIISLRDPPVPLNPRLDRAPPVADTRAGHGWRNALRRRWRMPLR